MKIWVGVLKRYFEDRRLVVNSEKKAEELHLTKTAQITKRRINLCVSFVVFSVVSEDNTDYFTSKLYSRCSGKNIGEHYSCALIASFR